MMHGRKKIPKFGLGCENLNLENLGIINVALAAGVTLFDTADCYGNHESEKALGLALKSTKRDEVFICSKVGVQYDAEVAKVKGDKKYIKQACAESLKRLQIDYLDILYLHRIDPNTPIEQSIRALQELIEEGKIKGIGLSEASASQIRRAHRIYPIRAVQIEFAPWSRHDEKNGVINACKELGIEIVAYSPLGRGFFTKNDKQFFSQLPEEDYRKLLPRYSGKILDTNLREREKLFAFAKRKECTLAQLILAWEMKQGIVPIPGTTNANHLKENIGALSVKLSQSDIEALDAILTNSHYSGPRYPSKKVSAIYPENMSRLHKSKSTPTLFKSDAKPKRQHSSDEIHRLTNTK